MAETTAIEWCDATFNPWMGCTRVSPACDDCYAARSTPVRAMGIAWGPGAPRRRTAESTWEAPKRWARAAAKAGRRPRVFCASLADWLDNEVPIEWLVDLLDLIRCTPELDWLLLSKRIGNWRKRVAEAHSWCASADDSAAFHSWADAWLRGTPPANVWLGATVVSQAEADRDVPKLLAVPARVRFLSVEPMLGPIVLPPLRCDHGSLPGPGGVGGVTCPDCNGHGARNASGCLRLHWVIAGGESGPKARPSQIAWFRSLMQQCKAAGVAFHMKQLGAQPRGWCAVRVHVSAEENAELEDDYCDFYEAHEIGGPCPGRCGALADKKGGDMAEWPEELRVREFPR